MFVQQTNSQQVKVVSKYGEALTPLDEAALVMYQLPSAQEMLPILSILPEVTSLHQHFQMLQIRLIVVTSFLGV